LTPLDNVTAHFAHPSLPTRTRRPQDVATHRRGPTLPAHRLPHLPGQVAIPEQLRTAAGSAALERFNTAPAADVEHGLLHCCRSLRWARRLIEHRPYPDLDALLAAADEAAYDLTPAELDDALAGESLTPLPDGAYSAAHTALSAAHTAYQSRFGHAFVICLDEVAPEETPDRVLSGIRSRLTNDPDEERPLAAEELRRLTRGRLTRLIQDFSG
jgi:2-oxo-4-hydroxy-4-carboxy--5-ureidoimidazoline (OHCU) decarboxylase